MKLKPLPEWAVVLLAAPVVAMAIPPAILVAAWVGLVWLKRKALGPDTEWRRWFAWHPAKVDWGDWRWLETVERRSFAIMQDTYYRPATQEGEKP